MHILNFILLSAFILTFSKIPDKDDYLRLSIEYCEAWSTRGAFMQVKELVHKNFKNVRVIGSEYPLPKTRKYLLMVIRFAQFLVVPLLLFPKQLKPYTEKLIDNYVMDWISENKMRFGIIAFIAGNAISGMISNTGAFEMFLDGDPIFSALKTGGMPDVRMLFNILRSKGGIFIGNDK